MWIRQLCRQCNQHAEALGCLIGLIGVLVFGDLFHAGRIWAEEGRLFLSALIQHSEDASHPWLYLHSGHWDLWTTIIAALAYQNPSSSPLIFSWGSIPPYLITAWSMLKFQHAFRQQKETHWLLATLSGLLAILILAFAGDQKFYSTPQTRSGYYVST